MKNKTSHAMLMGIASLVIALILFCYIFVSLLNIPSCVAVGNASSMSFSEVENTFGERAITSLTKEERLLQEQPLNTYIIADNIPIIEIREGVFLLPKPLSKVIPIIIATEKQFVNIEGQDKVYMIRNMSELESVVKNLSKSVTIMLICVGFMGIFVVIGLKEMVIVVNNIDIR